MDESSIRQRLREYAATIPLFDTHEHIPPEERDLKRPWSFFTFFEHYTCSDLVSAGMSREALEKMRDQSNGLSLEERWKLMAPYWPYAKTTGYGKAMCAYMRDLFDVEDINEDTYLTLCERIAEARKPGWYRHVLKERANIELSIVITWPGEPVDVDKELFRAAPVLDHFATPATRDDLEALERETGSSIQTLEQLMAAQEARLDAFKAQGIAAVKIFMAYHRTLDFAKTSQQEAARVFDRIWLSQKRQLSFEDLKPLQDFMTRRVIGLAADRGLPIEVHTGMQEGNGNYLRNSDPLLLTNVFLEFGDARFDVFHAGYPWTSHMAVLAKNFQNVYANLTWVPAISPRVFSRTLHEWIETIPANKIFAIGGDSNYVEGAYGHCILARDLAVDVLAEKVEEGYLTENEARWYLGLILRDNAKAFYRL